MEVRIFLKNKERVPLYVLHSHLVYIKCNLDVFRGHILASQGW